MNDGNVFEKILYASTNGQGVTLKPSEVWLLLELTGDAIPLANDKMLEWSEFYKELEVMQGLDRSDDPLDAD